MVGLKTNSHRRQLPQPVPALRSCQTIGRCNLSEQLLRKIPSEKKHVSQRKSDGGNAREHEKIDGIEGSSGDHFEWVVIVKRREPGDGFSRGPEASGKIQEER